jgi:hypothetical protein
LEVEVLADTPLYLLPTLQASSTASTNNYNTLNDLRQNPSFKPLRTSHTTGVVLVAHKFST